MLSLALSEAQDRASPILDLSHDALGFRLRAPDIRWLIRTCKPGSFQAVTHLLLNGHSLGHLEVNHLRTLFAHIGPIQRLSLADCELGDDGLKALIHLHDTLTALTAIDLDDNAITADSLSNWLQRASLLEQLIALSLNRNPLGDDGASVLAYYAPRLAQLQHLELARCGITDLGFAHLLPAVLGPPWRESLKTIYIRHNPLREVPELISEYHDKEHWIMYAATLLDSRRILNFASVLIVGQGGVGKSHLRRRLFDKHTDYFVPNPPRTIGFDSYTWTVRMPLLFEEEALIARVLDFAGQREMHSTHRLFLSDRRCVFVIVCDATRTRDENRLDYWLHLIKNEASPQCPIFVVVCKCDLYDARRDETIPRQLEALSADELRASVGLPTDTLLEVHDGIGWSDAVHAGVDEAIRTRHWTAIETLERRLIESMGYIPGVLNRYSPLFSSAIGWLEREGLRRNQSSEMPYLELSTFQERCRDGGLDDGHILAALRIAHSLGIVYYAGLRTDVSETDELKGLLFNPEWLRVPLYRVMTKGRDLSVRGLLSPKQIETVLPEHSTNATGHTLWERCEFTRVDRQRIIRVMLACELMFEARHQSGRVEYLVPDHLDARAARDAPRGDYVWRRRFRWLSESAFCRLVGRLHRQASRDQAAIWRDEITVAIAPNMEATVRMVIGRNDTARNTPDGTEVFVAISGCPEQEARRIRALIDGELRSIIGEPLIGADEWVRVGSGSGIGLETGLGEEISVDAECLLEALVRIRESERRSPEHAWRSKFDWFGHADYDRRREDAQEKIQELLRRGLIEVRTRGKAGKWRQYRATMAGQEYIKGRV